MNIIDVILAKYPDIQGVTYWYTKPDGSEHNDPYDGLLWDNKEFPKPTRKELVAWAKTYDLVLRQKEAVKKRKYPAIEKQLEMLYDDKLNGTNTWFETIQNIKLANPKPTK